MTDAPMIFSAPMVRALLDGRKSQTRRVMPAKSGLDAAHTVQKIGAHWIACEYDRKWPVRLPYAVGDRLYVREAHAMVGTVDPQWLLYRADGYESECIRHGFTRPFPPESALRWRPSIHMPRWASRLTLTVADVRVQRLQEISEADAWAGGCKQGDPWDSGEGFFPAEEPSPDGKGIIGWDCARDWYADLWDSLHGPDAWDANPWVVAVSFAVQRGNIDQIGGTHD